MELKSESRPVSAAQATSTLWRAAGLRKTLGLVCVLAAAFFVLARLTYDPNDLGMFSYPPQDPANNLCGWLGAQIAGRLLLAFGEAYWMLPLACVLLGFRVAAARPIRPAVFAHSLLLSLATISVVIYVFYRGTPPWGPSYGGFFGLTYGGLFIEYLGMAGTWLLVAACLCLLFFGFDLGHIFDFQAAAEVLKREKAPEKSGVVKREKEKSKVNLAGDGKLITIPPSAWPKDLETEPEELPGELMSAASAPKAARPQVGRGASILSVRTVGAKRSFTMPPDSILDLSKPSVSDDDEILRERARNLEEVFATFKIGCRVIGQRRGPTITQFELEVDEGIRVNKVTALTNEVAMRLKSISVRFVAPIPGRNTIGIELPNMNKEAVNLRSIIEHPDYKAKVHKQMLPLLLGKDVAGEPLISDLSRMPHMLVAGTTGSGKSVCINSIVVSLLLHHSPETLKLIMIDPKMVEMSGYEDIPHLMTPVITDMSQAASILEWACVRMDERYGLLANHGVRDISSFNQLSKTRVREKLEEGVELENIEWPMPYIVIIVDEFSDLMMTGAKEIEIYITRLAQKSRAVGIHVILATQRPSVDVITGLIKTNMPTRLAFQVAAQVDSRTILDTGGAEKLLGMGDMLFRGPGDSSLRRAQGVHVSDPEINRVVEHWKAQGKPQYQNIKLVARPNSGGGSSGGGMSFDGGGGEDDDEALYAEAVLAVLENDKPSASFIQRQLRVGYNKASRLIEMMEERGVVSPTRGSNKRDILVELDQWKISQGMAATASEGS